MASHNRTRRTVRHSRALGIALTPKAEKYLARRAYGPGQHGRARKKADSNYATQLKEKQRLRAQYNIREAQMRRAYLEAKRTEGQTGKNMVEHLESRLDALVLRSGFARTIAQARQMVVHRHIKSNSAGDQHTAESGGTDAATTRITLAHAQEAVDRAAVRYDRGGDQHYDVVSAFIKSIRGSDVDAAVHYLARMLEGGEDPRFVARRIMIVASEDIGLADPQALQVATAAAQSVALVGMPEARIILSQAVIYCALAPKSNAAYVAINKAISDVRAGKSGQVPAHLRDAHYAGAAALGHGEGYVYAHDEPGHIAAQQYLPDTLHGTVYYEPTSHGFERTLTERRARIREILNRVPHHENRPENNG